jgi:L-serine dehydratase
MKFTATLANGKEHVATFYSIGGGFVVKEERVNAKKKIEIKHAFPFPTDKVDVLATVLPKTRKSLKSFMKTRNPCVPQ